ncbi:MAG: class I SAM-dependent methyltransferase [Gemmatimonadaceae bacterium]|nr:class I SAM-dependent methyltransferase [Acetobacteraceae bacterium]
MMDSKPDVDATAIWDERYEKGEHVGSKEVIEGDPIDYTQHKFLYQHAIAKPLTGSMDGWSVDSIARQWFSPAPPRVLAIGSGMAFLEEYLVAQGYAGHVTAYEMSRTAIEAAKARVADKPYAARLDLRAGDVLTEDLPTAGFDAVFVQAAIHHFDRIEDMYALMHRVLKPGGLLWFDEYIGPDHHMYEPEVLAIMDEVNECLAPKYRWDVLAKQTRTMVPRPSLDFMMGHDPSEGVHASRIMPLTYQWFDVVHRQDYGGAIMRPFFTGILPNFDWADPADQTVARMVILIEQMLTRTGVLPNYHTAVVGRRRDQPRAPLSAEEAARINYSDWPGLAQAAPKSLWSRLSGR